MHWGNSEHKFHFMVCVIGIAMGVILFYPVLHNVFTTDYGEITTDDGM